MMDYNKFFEGVAEDQYLATLHLLPWALASVLLSCAVIFTGIHLAWSVIPTYMTVYYLGKINSFSKVYSDYLKMFK